MQELLDQLKKWVHEDGQIALATVVSTWGSSPRAVGARMAIRSDGGMLGSVSGGCVEGAVVEAALEVLGGEPPRLLQYGVSDETAWDVGLACGGSIEVFVQRFNTELLGPITKGHTDRQTLIEAIVIDGSESQVGTTGIFDVDGLVAGDWSGDLHARTEVLIKETLEDRTPKRVKVEVGGESVELFLDVFLPSETLIMIGGVHISIALSEMASMLGYRTIVIDPRKSFATQERFPNVDQMIQHWPEEGLDEVGIDAHTAIAVLTHDPKIDDPALLTALRSPAFYVGALGSRATHARRVERLREEGLKTDALARLKAPIGLDLGGRTPEDIAVSILAEITATRHGKNLKIA